MSENQSKSTLESRVEGLDLIIERDFEAPRELVFSAFSEPVHLAAWWGPQGWETTIYELDFKVNGTWKYSMKCMDKNQGEFFGMMSCGMAVYEEIVVPEKIVYKDLFTDSEFNVLPDMPGMIITVEFLEKEGKTTVISRTKFSTAEALKQVVDMGVVEGMSSQYEKLEKYLLEIQ